MDDLFISEALPLVFVFEGLLSDDPNDRGGLTYKGIIQKVYDSYRVSKKLATQSVAKISEQEVLDIYRVNYWLSAKCDQIGGKLSIVVFDTAVNMGPGRAAKFIQKAVGATVDGLIGKETLKKVKSFDSLKLANVFMDTRVSFYKEIVERDPTQACFLVGWLRRATFLRAYINGVKNYEQIKKEW